MPRTIGPGRTMDGRLVQVGLPKAARLTGAARLNLEVADRETGERGAGCVFLPSAP
jgi:hypothetical protein